MQMRLKSLSAGKFMLHGCDSWEWMSFLYIGPTNLAPHTCGNHFLSGKKWPTPVIVRYVVSFYVFSSFTIRPCIGS